jgi:hypothetical protein
MYSCRSNALHIITEKNSPFDLACFTQFRYPVRFPSGPAAEAMRRKINSPLQNHSTRRASHASSVARTNFAVCSLTRVTYCSLKLVHIPRLYHNVSEFSSPRSFDLCAPPRVGLIEAQRWDIFRVIHTAVPAAAQPAWLINSSRKIVTVCISGRFAS